MTQPMALPLDRATGIGHRVDVDVIIATRDRPELLEQAIQSILDQDFDGGIRITVVYDNCPANAAVARSSPGRSVRVLENGRSPGLPGARNTGLLAADAALVAFCDDDDSWRPLKLDWQTAAMRETSAVACVSGIEVHYADRRRVRLPAVSEVTVAGLSGSRLTGAHPSTYLFDRRHLLSKVGLVDEDLPYGYGEDYDLLIRSAGQGLVTVVPQVTADILWHPAGSYFSQRWEAMADGIEYLMGKHPVIGSNPRGAAWMEGQRAFALAAQGNRKGAAMRAAGRSLRQHPKEPRAYLALAIVAGLIRPAAVLKILNSRGRGI
ncbi:MAG TPA: glycosyltransferase family A protein [Micrococcaceae bacterium]|jgi:glycosyltransferase involved in cell wall biosynthesis